MVYFLSRRFGLISLVATCSLWSIFPAEAQPESSPGHPQEQHALLTDELRLATIGYQLGVSNAELCQVPKMLTGLIVHNIADYDRAVRDQVTKTYNLSSGFGILAVVPSSSAETAGLKAGDEMIAINGKYLAKFAAADIGQKASFSRTAFFESYLSGALSSGDVTVTIRRASAVLSRTLHGQLGCGGDATIDLGQEFNAWSDGENVSVTRRLVTFANTDGQLAFVIAHEMAHNINHDYANTSSTSMILAEFGFGADAIKKRENDADIQAIHMMVKAGFNPEAAVDFLRRSRIVRWFDIATTHSGVGTRISIVTREIAQVSFEGGSKLGQYPPNKL